VSLTVPVAEIVSESHDPLLAAHPSWNRIPLGEIAKILNGFAFPSRFFSKGNGTPLLRIRDVGRGRTDCRYDGPFDDRYLVRDGDLVVGMDGDFRCARWHGSAALLNQRVCKVTLQDDAYDPSFLDLVLPGYLRALKERTSSVTVTHLSSRSLAEIPMPLPPLAEQRRIANRLAELMGRLGLAQERVARVPTILKRFRQSVLAAACSGRLTEDWRVATPDEVRPEPLISLIRKERAKVIRRAPVRPADAIGLEFPEEWELASLDELASRITSGSRAWKKHYREDGSGTFIMAQNVRPLFFDRSVRQGVEPPEDDSERERTQVAQDDLLITIVGANTGDVCRVRDRLDRHYVCQSVALIRPAVSGVSPFLELFLNSRDHGRRVFDDWIYGEGRPHLSFDQLRATAIAVPSLDEQRVIVSRVRELFDLADAVEKRVSTAAICTEKLIQAVLAKAFRGELVPTEAELSRREGRGFEPASPLLLRVVPAQARS